MTPDKQHITLQLDAHRVKLDVPRDQEAVYREAAEHLNKRFEVYRRSMLQASAEQLWMYVALESAVNLQSDARDKAIRPIEKTLQALNEQITQALQQ